MTTSQSKVAIITASDSGIGSRCAEMLAEQGFDIGITWRSDEEGAQRTAQRVREIGRRAEIIQLDLADPERGGQSLQQLIDKFGRIDVLVNNAGANFKADFLDVTYEDWRKTFAVDVDGVFVCGQIAARKMVEQGEGGRIINITSVHEHTPLPGSVAYTAAKHEAGGLTKSMELSLLPHNILVNVVVPGDIAPPMNKINDEGPRQVMMPEIPVGRPGYTHYIAILRAWRRNESPIVTTAHPYITDCLLILAYQS
ncbi:MAG TPA: SDR family oxidoreductase, partial [Pantoea sp.]|nr:SDR family oxidoreductase [Pantoea sp.]